MMLHGANKENIKYPIKYNSRKKSQYVTQFKKSYVLSYVLMIITNRHKPSIVPGLPSAGKLQAVMNLRAVSFAKYPNWVVNNTALSRSTCKPCRLPPKIMRRKREGQELG